MNRSAAHFGWLPLLVVLLQSFVCPSCQPVRDGGEPVESTATDSSLAARERIETEEARYGRLRREMVEWQLADRDIVDQAVLDALTRVPRHMFVPERLQELAYSDGPLPIGLEQTISQPYIVALMTQLARARPDSRALDIGTGSGYQAAVLAELVEQVYSVEILCPLADEAAARLKRLGYTNTEVRCADGYRGWPEHAPFDLIILAAAPDHIPEPLVEQLAVGGRLILPVGDLFQELIVVEKQLDGQVARRRIIPV